MELEPDVEQVGFISYEEDLAAGGVPVSLRMAGGEFCGNATMCAAALFAIRSGLQGGAVPVKVWGISAPFEVLLERQAALSYSAAVRIPPALDMDELRLADGMLPGSDSLNLPIVRMAGISHVIIEPDSGFFGLKDDPALAETLLRGWCGVLGAECLGMMFLGEGAAIRQMIPLVYVPGADTMFWENSCASGSAAAGMYLAAKAGAPVDVTFDEPAGRMRVESDPVTGRTILHGSAILRK
jgi:diaminopimelate epimerase